MSPGQNRSTEEHRGPAARDGDSPSRPGGALPSSKSTQLPPPRPSWPSQVNKPSLAPPPTQSGLRPSLRWPDTHPVCPGAVSLQDGAGRPAEATASEEAAHSARRRAPLPCDTFCSSSLSHFPRDPGMCPHLGAGSVIEGCQPEAPTALGKHCLRPRQATDPLPAWGGGWVAEHYGVTVLDSSLCHASQNATLRASPQEPGIKTGIHGVCDNSVIALKTFILEYFI